MKKEYIESATRGRLIFTQSDKNLKKDFHRDEESALLSIVWNRGNDQRLIIDDIAYTFRSNQFLSLMMQQSVRFSAPEMVTLWEFNRDFYCVVDHDEEVSCAGFLFYGWHGTMFLDLSEGDIQKMDTLAQVFSDEFDTHDNIQGEMLRMLLKRLIILLTRLAKKQYLEDGIDKEEYNIVRQFSLLVENNYKKLHKVQDYANLLFKAPKTLSNLFAKYSDRTPLQIIRERIALEARRLLMYTDMSISEITYELGFEEPAHFSRFFKKMTTFSPSIFKKSQKNAFSGTIGNS